MLGLNVAHCLIEFAQELLDTVVDAVQVRAKADDDAAHRRGFLDLGVIHAAEPVELGVRAIFAERGQPQHGHMMTARVITTILRPPKRIRTSIVVMALAVIMPSGLPESLGPHQYELYSRRPGQSALRRWSMPVNVGIKDLRRFW